MKLEEFSQIGKLVTENISADAQVIIGARINKDFEGRVRVITIMTGVSSPYILGKQRIQDLSLKCYQVRLVFPKAFEELWANIENAEQGTINTLSIDLSE